MMQVAPEKCRNSDAARVIRKSRSTEARKLPRTTFGSSGLGASGGGLTNWKRRVTSPSETLPLVASVIGRTQFLPSFFAMPCSRSARKSKSPWASRTLPSIASLKTSAYWWPRCSNTGNDAGRFEAGTTIVFFASWPIVTSSRRRKWRSSMIFPAWITPIRRILFEAVADMVF
jgi:hypothetical protein